MYVVIYILKWGVVAVWFVTALQWSFEGTAMYLFFKREINKLKRAVKG
jgi:Na+-driven multidrug efflux pump